jgi:hypothetical protein
MSVSVCDACPMPIRKGDAVSFIDPGHRPLPSHTRVMIHAAYRTRRLRRSSGRYRWHGPRGLEVRRDDGLPDRAAFQVAPPVEGSSISGAVRANEASGRRDVHGRDRGWCCKGGFIWPAPVSFEITPTTGVRLPSKSRTWCAHSSQVRGELRSHGATLRARTLPVPGSALRQPRCSVVYEILSRSFNFPTRSLNFSERPPPCAVHACAVHASSAALPSQPPSSGCATAGLGTDAT